MSEPSKIRITHDPASPNFLRVCTLRTDAPSGEPYSLGVHAEIPPGDTVTLPIPFGAIILLTEPQA